MSKLPHPLSVFRLPSSIHSEKGFSLVEILLVIMMVGFIVSLINTLPSSLGLIGISKHEAIAKEVAQKKIEDLRSLGYDNLANTSSPAPAISDARLNNIPQGAGNYAITDCVAPLCTHSELIKSVLVTVNWKETGNKSKQVQVNTLISKNGLK